MKYFLYVFIVSLFFSNAGYSSNKNERLIYQLLNSEELDEYWHAESNKTQLPVVVLLPRSVTMDDMKLKKNGKYVLFTHAPLSYKNLFIVKTINEEDKKTTVSFVYGREGINGQAIYNKNENSWNLKQVNINES